ncbi:MAG TPA: LuxR C-terminal-related transcriptional regulator [Candidatus Gastranaerophilaceae bacterium]|nr:LuxR C-terminal-related transcriptional regulator [Candidatus Gastranaerophilaceae bacterium]HPT40768.1 LuxR C-terminal-related transcriptional regulator [Candidatus Gastranaerophilaceae bacterium]
MMKLSNRELEILELLSFGYSDKEIAYILNISARTVQTHVMRSVIKLNARNRTNAVANYIRHYSLNFSTV